MLSKKLTIQGILGSFNKTLSDIENFVEQAKSEQSSNDGKIHELEDRQTVLGNEIDQALKASKNIKDIIGV